VAREWHSGAKARRWEIAGALLGGVLAAAVIALAAATAIPPSMANLSSEVSDGRTPVPLAGGAAVVVPADWIVVREGADAVSVRTPDGALQALLDVVAEDADSVISADELVDGPARSEVLASGMTAVHADIPRGVLAAVSLPGGADAVRVRVTFGGGGDLARYRPAIGDLLEGVRA
jgi:hypothetical protein